MFSKTAKTIRIEVSKFVIKNRPNENEVTAQNSLDEAKTQANQHKPTKRSYDQLCVLK